MARRRKKPRLAKLSLGRSSISSAPGKTDKLPGARVIDTSGMLSRLGMGIMGRKPRRSYGRMM